MGKSTINGQFSINSFWYVYQRVNHSALGVPPWNARLASGFFELEGPQTILHASPWSNLDTELLKYGGFTLWLLGVIIQSHQSTQRWFLHITMENHQFLMGKSTINRINGPFFHSYGFSYMKNGDIHGISSGSLRFEENHDPLSSTETKRYQVPQSTASEL